MKRGPSCRGAAYRLGADQGRYRYHCDHRQHGRLDHAQGGRRPGGRGCADRIADNGDTPTRSGPSGGGACQGARHSVLRGGTVVDDRLSTTDGDAIPTKSAIAREVTHFGSNQLAPEGAHIRNPSFDVTPAKYTPRSSRKRRLSRSLRTILEIGNRRLIRIPRFEIRNAYSRN